jgi:choline/glycine/proline betaine transport protein
LLLRLHVTQFLAEKVTQYRVSAEAISCETFYGRRHPAAMTLVQEELNKQGTISHISDAVDDRIRLEVDLGNELNFIYEVRLRGYSSPTFALAAMDNNEQQTEQHRYYRAEVYLKEGGQNYDVMGWNQEQLINDILDQYEKHLHFLHLVR